VTHHTGHYFAVSGKDWFAVGSRRRRRRRE